MRFDFTVMKLLRWLLLSALTATCAAETQNQIERTQHAHLFVSKTSDVVEFPPEIKVVCKGLTTLEREGRKGKGREQFEVITTYIISYQLIESKNSHEWVIQVDNNGFLQAEYFSDQSHGNKPFRQSSVLVNESQILYKFYSSSEPYAKVDYGSKNQRLLTINRLTGEWYERFERITEWVDGRKLIQTDTTVGSCEKATQKF